MAETDDMTPEQIAEAQRQNCIFCKIAKKEMPSKIIHETDKVICVMDINPASEGHLLIFPKEHYMILPHLPQDVSNELFKTVKLMSKNLLKTLQCKGTSIFIANGMAAGQKGPHVLIHLFPRKEGDGLLEFDTKDADEGSLARLIQQMKPYMPQLLGDASIAPIPKPSTIDERYDIEEQKEDEEEKSEKSGNVDEDGKTGSIEEDEEESEERKPAGRKGKKEKKASKKKKSQAKKRKESDSKEKVQAKILNLDEISKLFG